MRWPFSRRGRPACEDDATRNAEAERDLAQQQLDEAIELAAQAQLLLDRNGFAEAVERSMRRRFA
ncbi:DUF7620 family protein [Mycobacteroides immunogenum]|uniref:DUF7620 family protein n=1 Tax=Mycobacteroides immunogenum TaxID=83262 RepID=UPI0006C85AEE|nr:hypothetical protein [Mycobacteroides immunogenum]MCV7307362.1 hypothetical protein [Mycobacteroides immunogenum]